MYVKRQVFPPINKHYVHAKHSIIATRISKIMDKKLPFDVMYDFILPKDLLLSNNQVAKLQCINMCI